MKRIIAKQTLIDVMLMLKFDNQHNMVVAKVKSAEKMKVAHLKISMQLSVFLSFSD